MVCTSSAMARMSLMVPRMLLACVQETNLVLSESRGRRFSGVKRGFLVRLASGAHHFSVRFWRWAMRTQEEMLASWSVFETMISEPGGKWRVWARLAKSWVVEGPITRVLMWAVSFWVGEKGERERACFYLMVRGSGGVQGL